MAIINLGSIRFNWCGEYNKSVVYTKDDVVGYDGSSFIAKNTVNGIHPPAPDYWDLMVAGAEKPYAVGEQKLMAFRATDLPFGWYIRNGDNYLLDSPQGRILNSLSSNYKEDWDITIKVIKGKQYINVPTAFTSDGRGYFERAVDGITRQVGSIENDAIRNIKAGFENFLVSATNTSGAFKIVNISSPAYDGNSHGWHAKIDFDASLVVPTGKENTVINQGKTPAIYLGV